MVSNGEICMGSEDFEKNHEQTANLWATGPPQVWPSATVGGFQFADAFDHKAALVLRWAGRQGSAWILMDKAREIWQEPCNLVTRLHWANLFHKI